MNTKKVGILGEQIAERFLKNKGYEILTKNYLPKFVSGPLRGEIDIVAKKGDTIFFVEVKTLVEQNGDRSVAIFPEDKVNLKKQRKIIKMAESWLMEKKISMGSKWQIDIISIKIDLTNKKAKIRHFKNAIF